MPAIAMNISPAKWPAVPAPAVDIRSLSGFAFIMATSSCRVLTGSEGLAAISVGWITKRATGVRSLSGSNETFLTWGSSATLPDDP